MENPNLRNLVIYGKPQEELVEALKNLPNGRSVPPGEGLPVKLEYDDTSIYVGQMSDGTLITSTVTGQDDSGVEVPFSEDKLQLLAKTWIQSASRIRGIYLITTVKSWAKKHNASRETQQYPRRVRRGGAIERVGAVPIQ
jgi:hypothetical protein